MSTSEHVHELLISSLSSLETWSARPNTEDLAALPGCPAVFLFVDDSGAPVQLLTTQQLKRVVISRLSEPVETKRGRTDLAEVVRGVRWRQVHSPFEARWWYYRLIRELHPREYRKEVSFGPAWFLHADWARPIPELRVSERVWRVDGEFIGPWPTHKSCQQALEGLWDLFDLCRYPEQLRKTPEGTRCAYADMGRCDAPCDGSVPLQRYVQRCRAAWQFAQGGVAEWVQSAAERMRHAAAEQRYELAGQLKQQLEFARGWQRRWSPTVRRLEQLRFLFAVPATRRKAWKLFLFRQGYLSEGPLLSDRKLAEQAPVWLSEQLQHPPDGLDTVTRMEQTWLVAHFLRHKDARTAIVEPLPDAGVPEKLGETLRAALRQRRERLAESSPPSAQPNASSDAV
jgi:DNA polymerase-3 subunit epsilon